MSDTQNPIIIIKKIKKNKPVHHGGAWKIAYADFVTAMMAFFMLMWLLSMLNKYQLQGVSAYFQKPLKDVFIGAKNADSHKRTVQETKEENDNKGNSSPVVQKNHASVVVPVKNLNKDQQQPSFKKDRESDKIKGDVSNEMDAIKRQLDVSLKNNPAIHAYKEHLSFEIIEDGIRVMIKDLENEPMFSLGRADFKNYTKSIIHWLSDEFNRIPKKILIMGYTDSIPYKPSASYTNWELSVDRANATRRFLVQQGMDSTKVIRISGSADMALLDKKREFNPVNRRIEVIILTDAAAKKIMN